MRVSHATVWIGLLWLVAANCGAQAVSGANACAARLGSDTDVSIDTLRAACPDWMHRLDRAGVTAWLPDARRQSAAVLSPAALEGLQALVNRELETVPPTVSADPARLEGILRELEAANAPRGLWQRFKRWLRSWMDPADAQRRPGWWHRFAAEIDASPLLLRRLVGGVLAAVVGVALFVVASEARMAGPIDWRRWLWRGGAVQHVPPASSTPWPQLDAGPPRERLARLVVWISRRLGERGLLGASDGLTLREIASSAQLADPGDRGRLERVAAAAEAARFSQHELPLEGLESAVACGRELLVRLSGADTAA